MLPFCLLRDLQLRVSGNTSQTKRPKEEEVVGS